MAKYPIRHEKNEPSGEMLRDGKLALGIAIGIIGALLTFVAFDLWLGAHVAENYYEIVPLIVSLLVAAASTYFAANALREQRKAREAGTDPVLVAHLGQREDARELVTFNISNVGAGAALNVLLKVEEPEGGLGNRNIVTNIFKNHHPFSVLLQGKSIEFSLAVGWELLGDFPLSPFRVHLSFEDLTGGKYESDFVIDVREMEGLGANKSPTMRAVAALESIAKKLSST
jgi:hypothetical protein